MITQTELKELLDYNPETGIFTWKVYRQGVKGIGSVAGYLNKAGYIKIMINGKFYQAHRLAWFYIHGEWPKNYIDHINGQKDDNRIENLRDVSRNQNQQNRNCHRNGHLIGTTFNKHAKKWQSQIVINGKQKHIGLFETEQEAHEAYLNKLKELENV